MNSSSLLPRKINDDLLLRQSTSQDAKRLGDFYVSVFKLPDGNPDTAFAPWVRDLLNGRYPIFKEGDFTIVEDIRSGQIVSAMNLISQTWTYDGIPIKVGRPEAVGTAPDYRNQGLVRSQVEVVHEWSAQRGELLQGITGIPYYYRQFGYEMCIEMDGGQMGTSKPSPPSEKQSQSYRIRLAEETDVPFLVELYRVSCERILIACQRDENVWKYELSGKSIGSDERWVVWVIESNAGELLGFFIHPPFLGPEFLNENGINCKWYALKAGVSYLDVTPVVLQHLWETGKNYAEQRGKTYSGIGLWLETNHPALEVTAKSLPQGKKPYAWYIRVPDLPALLYKISSVLEKRLENSCCSRYSGDLNLTFYRSKLRLSFKEGRLAEVSQVRFSGEEGCLAAFPDQTFLHLVFGYRTLEEVEYMFPDCWAEDLVRPVINTLFPRQPSNIWPIA